MKTNSFLIVCLLTLFFITTGVSAQEKHSRFGAGLNYPIGLKKNGFEENHIGINFMYMYNFSNSPLSADISMSYESYTIFPTISKYPYNGRSVAVIPAVVYNFNKSKYLQSYCGLGAGISIDNIETGVFNEGYAIRFACVPKIGIRILNHIDIVAKYYVTHKDFSRLMIGCGYTF